jgi:integrase
VAGKLVGKKSSEKLTQARVNALCMWPGGEAYTVRDLGVRGLEVYKGKLKTTFNVYEARRIGHGERVYSSKVIGDASKMSLVDARKIAKRMVGRERIGPGKRKSVTFKDAFADYMIHLQDRAASRGKPAAWAARVEGLARLHLSPKWSKWSLAEMSEHPRQVREWHGKLSKSAGPVSANHCARVVRACYRHAMKLNRDLPAADPTSGVRWNIERPRQAGVPIAQWPKWGRAWLKIVNRNRAAFHLLQLLVGGRPGEVSRLKWTDIDCRARSIAIQGTKSGGNIIVPMSAAIAGALKLARDSVRQAEVESEWIFPARADGHLTQWFGDIDPCGHALRHWYRDAAQAVGIDDFSSRLLMGHSLHGVNAEYLTKAMIASGPSLREMQRKISKEIVRRIKL